MDNIKLEEGDVLLVEGLINLEILGGEITVSGGLHGKGQKVTIPKSKSVPLEASTDTLIEYEKKEGGKIEKLSERTIPSDWDPIIDEIIEKEPERIAILGEPDTGKTFFTTYMANRLLNHGLSSAIVDTDAGQSDIGAPGTIGMGIVDSHKALLSEVSAEEAYFMGSMSPSGHMLEYMVGIKKMAEHGLQGANMVIVDTPGWVVGGPGRALQHFSIELLVPDFVIGLQRENELEHLLGNLRGEVRRATVSGKVRERTQQERSELRKKGLSEYFEGSERISLGLDDISIERTYLGTGTELDPEELNVEGINYAEEIAEGIVVVSARDLSDKEIQKLQREFGKVNTLSPGDEKNLLVSLIDEDKNLIGVGSVESIDYSSKGITVVAPIDRDVDKVDKIQVGSMKIKPTGEEVGTVRPGTF